VNVKRGLGRTMSSQRWVASALAALALTADRNAKNAAQAASTAEAPPRPTASCSVVTLPSYDATRPAFWRVLRAAYARVMEKATFAGGCFCGVEHLFNEIPGVIDAVSGYAGGNRDNPTYEQVCSGRTGHAEAVEVTFDPARVTYAELLNAFWNMHDPTTLNRQGPDHGHQYRSVIFYHDAKQEQEARRSMAAAQRHFDRPIVTEIVPIDRFWRAEEYHQRYFDKHQGHYSCHFMRGWVPLEATEAGAGAGPS
jgi:peptide-methionine (S)-S-oxide reductase